MGDTLTSLWGALMSSAIRIVSQPPRTQQTSARIIQLSNTIFLLHFSTQSRGRGLFVVATSHGASPWTGPVFTVSESCSIISNMVPGVYLTDCMWGGNRSEGTESLSSDLRLYHKTDIIPKLLLLSGERTRIRWGVIFREQGAAIQCTLHHTP